MHMDGDLVINQERLWKENVVIPFEWAHSQKEVGRWRTVLRYDGVNQALLRARNPSPLPCCHCLILIHPLTVSQASQFCSLEVGSQSPDTLFRTLLSQRPPLKISLISFTYVATHISWELALAHLHTTSFPKSGCDTFICSFPIIYQLPSSNLQDLEQRHFPMPAHTALLLVGRMTPSLLAFAFLPSC